jgi:hypothetical protein
MELFTSVVVNIPLDLNRKIVHFGEALILKVLAVLRIIPEE